MFLTEYNEELHERTCREEEWKEGRMEGINGTIISLRKLGHSDDEIQEVLKETYSLTDIEVEKYMR